MVVVSGRGSVEHRAARERLMLPLELVDRPEACRAER
jgi:hypothetical protein